MPLNSVCVDRLPRIQQKIFSKVPLNDRAEFIKQHRAELEACAGYVVTNVAAASTCMRRSMRRTFRMLRACIWPMTDATLMTNMSASVNAAMVFQIEDFQL